MLQTRSTRLLRVVGLCWLALAPSGFTHADAQTLPDNRIRVMGSAQIVIEADRAELNFLVEGYGSNLEQAVIHAQDRVLKVKETLAATGVPTEAVSVARFSAGENWFGRSSWSSKKDFRAAIGITVVLDELLRLQPVLYALSDSKIESMSDVAFSSKDEASTKAQARELALEKAEEKATQLTAAIGARIVRVTGIEELPLLDRRYPLYRNYGLASPYNLSLRDNLSGITTIGEDGSGILLPGNISVSASFAVTYEYEAIPAGSSSEP